MVPCITWRCIENTRGCSPGSLRDVRSFTPLRSTTSAECFSNRDNILFVRGISDIVLDNHLNITYTVVTLD